MIRSAAVALAVFGGLAAAQSGPWQQCGGLYHTGPTTCVSGWTCVFVNDWYSQCLQSTSSAGPTSSSSSRSSSSSSRSSSSSTRSSSTAVPPSSTSSGPVPNPTIKYWFSFGDSYTQTGFEATGSQPSVANPLGNPTYPGYTACGSVPNYIGLDTIKYNSSLVYNYNLAYGGATIDANLVTPYTPTVKSLVDQTNIFLNTYGSHPSSAPWTSSNSVFTFFIGINDIGNSFWLEGDRAAFSDTLLNRYFELVKQIYDTGARNFLFVNVPPIDRSPLMLAQPQASRDAEATVIAGYNQKLAAKAAAFAAANPGTKTYIYDSHAELTRILDSPSTYGLKDATSYGSGSDVAWCNDYHISPAVHDRYAIGVSAILRPLGLL